MWSYHGSPSEIHGMSFEFPFEYGQIRGLGNLFYPVVHLSLLTVIGWRRFDFIVDTGADVTTIPSHFLPALGLTKSALPQTSTLGVGGYTVKTWEFQLPIRIGQREVTVLANAIETHDDTFPLLLGKKDFFEEKFNLLLDSKKKVTVLLENS